MDTAEGLGEGNDNSCFQVIDVVNCEQVAEYYSNCTPIHILSEIVNSCGAMYNGALVVVERESTGLALLTRLEFDSPNYDGLYYSEDNKAGIKTTKSSRPLFLQTLQSRLLTQSVIIRSKRLVYELKHFIFDTKTKTAKTASSIYHD